MSEWKIVRPLLSGFVLSVLLTLAAYFAVVEHTFHGWSLIWAIVGLAFAQAVVQLIFFLHLGDEPRPRWNIFVFYFMALVALILVLGSLWIMFNLDTRVMQMGPHPMPHEGI